MDITAIDRSATQGTSALHKARTGAKLVSFALVLTAVMVSWNALVLASLLLALAAVVFATGQNARLAFGLAAYPALFAGIFAFASAPSLIMAGTIVLKAVTAALAAVLLSLTTPYPRIFGAIQRVTPGVVGDALLMTYRAVFLLAQRFSEMRRVIRLRSPRRVALASRVTALAAALGNLLLYAFDLAQRDYDIMRVRGYAGRLRASAPLTRTPSADLATVAAASAMTAMAIIWRLGYLRLNPISWLPLGISLLLLSASLIWRKR